MLELIMKGLLMVSCSVILVVAFIAFVAYLLAREEKRGVIKEGDLVHEEFTFRVKEVSEKERCKLITEFAKASIVPININFREGLRMVFVFHVKYKLETCLEEKARRIKFARENIDPYLQKFLQEDEFWYLS